MYPVSEAFLQAVQENTRMGCNNKKNRWTTPLLYAILAIKAKKEHELFGVIYK